MEPEAYKMLGMPADLEYAPIIDGMSSSLLLKSTTNKSADFGTYAIYFKVQEEQISDIYIYKHVYKHKTAELKLQYSTDKIAFRKMKIKKDGCKFEIDISPATFKIWPCDGQFRAKLSSIFIKNVGLNEFDYIIDEDNQVVFIDQLGNQLMSLEINLSKKIKSIVTKDSGENLILDHQPLYPLSELEGQSPEN